MIYADHDLLHLAIDNLVDNALKYASENDKIEMRAARSVADTLGEIVTIVVADTGRGIPDADMPHVWDAFYRGNNTQGVPGSGMGLPIARAIIERHQGTIELHSPTRGGTEFIIRLPTEQPASQDR